MARAAAKVAISLDRGLLAKTENLRKATGESRSALVGRALRALLRAEAHSRNVQQYVEAYRRTPETLHEIRSARRLARQSLRELAWDEK